MENPDFQIEDFIEIVKLHPELNNKSSKHYLDTKRKERLWLDISNQFKIEGM